MKTFNKNLTKAIELTRKMLFLADKGDIQREDESCGVLFAVLRDSAYKIKHMAEKECVSHFRKGKWDGNEDILNQRIKDSKANSEV